MEISEGETVNLGGGIIYIGNDGYLTINDTSAEKTGKIDVTTDRKWINNKGVVTDNPAVWADIVIYPENGQKAGLTINGGTYIAPYYPISGNGTDKAEDSTTITINGGTFKSIDGLCIYHPQNGTLTISGGSFEGQDSAIEIRSGNLNISGGTFKATSTPSGSTANGNGTTSKGSAIAVAQHTTKLPINVNISGGTFEGYSAFYESNPQNNSAADIAKVNLSITGGTFEAINGGSVAVVSVDKNGFISGGTFSSAPNDYVAEGYIAKLQSSGKYKVNQLTNWIQLADTSWYNEGIKEFTIETAQQLAGLAELVNSRRTDFSGITIKLNENINLSGLNWTPIGKSVYDYVSKKWVNYSFKGTFDGLNKTISNLTINAPSTDNVGLFGITSNGSIKNLTVNNAEITGYLDVGVVAGTPYTSEYKNITVTGCVKVNGYSYVGGVFGKNLYANATDIRVNCDSYSYVKANSEYYRTYVGGIVGFMGEGNITVTNANSNIDVYGSTCDVGGVTGIAHYGNKFINCSSSGNVYITSYNDDGDQLEIGGIAGVWHNQSGTTVTLTNCSFTGNLSATHSNGTVFDGDFANGGLVGRQYNTSGTGTLIIENDNT